MAKTVRATRPASNPAPNQRNCCLLIPFVPLGVPGPGVGVADPAALGQHKYGGGDIYGSVYTCAAGFLDLGHLRDHIDLTKYYYSRLKKFKFAQNASFPATAYDGVIVITKDIPKADRIDVARSIAYSQSIAYEIFEYWNKEPGFHNSAFSPEDLVSNFLGTYVAGIALAAAGSFNAAATKALNDLLSAVGARPPADTNAVYQTINTIYVKSINVQEDILDPKFLKRRNFNTSPISPCLIPGVNGCSSTTFPSTIPTQFDPRISGYYTVEFTTPDDVSFLGRPIITSKMQIGPTLKTSDFDAAITKIKNDAQLPQNDGPNVASCGLSP